MKSCSICGEVKPITDFNKRAKAPDGHRADCKSCKKLRDAESYRKRSEQEGFKEKASKKVKTRKENMPEDLLKNLKRRELENCQRNRKKRSEKFIEDNGCSRKEFKRRQEQQELIEIGKKLNGDKYDYSEVFYQAAIIPVKIWCNKHREFFYQTPKDHKVGRGCQKCGKEVMGNILRKTQEEFVADALAFCGDKYTYNNVIYVDNKTSVQVTCETHGDFPVRPGNLLSGKGCPGCALYGYSVKRSGILYILSEGNLTKIGITNKTVDFRMRQLNSKGKRFKCLFQFPFEDGAVPSFLETTLLRELRNIYDQPSEKFDGWTECFYDVDHELLTSRIEQLTKELT